ncbi:prepilin peptidase [Lederbergia panacisoli]|uniref:prepilin peptidase n=1 Tax=Lederbergia panacisoli TaxID=1255251 RepID=UPI00214C8AD7|nr:A24 family peptidase [Lederbergia panacisoli]MCR2820548.1 prepilin peptidase [Lederbergia panacisoli]
MEIIILLYSLLLGSFFNVVGLRVPLKQSIVKPRSACPGCGHTLKAIELIPVLSYLIQGGKCRQCKRRISPLYPIMELSTALLFLFAYWQIGWTFEVIFAWTLISLFIIIFITDIKYMLIPNRILLFFIPLFLIERIILPLEPWWDSLLGAAIGFSLLLMIAVISKGGMGGGDIKLFGVIGFALGSKLVLLSFFAASVFGGIFGVIGMALGYFKKGESIPFGPFIGIGTLVVYFYHQHILDWYFSFF